MALTGIMVFLTCFLLVYAIALAVTATRRRVVARIEVLDPQPVRAREVRRATFINSKERGFHPIQSLESLLIRGEFEINARDFVVRWLVLTLCAAVLIFLIHGPLTALLTIIFSFIVTLLYLRMRSARRLTRFEEGLHDMLTIIANSLRAGHSFLQAIQVVTEDMHGPVQQELSRVLEELNVGVPLEQAFKSAADRLHSEDFNLIVTAILIQRQVGGNLAEVLDQIATTIRERVRLRSEVRVLTSQGRMSGLIFMFLPLVIGTLMFIISPTYMTILFHNAIGLMMLVVAVILQVFGYVVIRRIVDIKL